MRHIAKTTESDGLCTSGGGDKVSSMEWVGHDLDRGPDPKTKKDMAMSMSPDDPFAGK